MILAGHPFEDRELVRRVLANMRARNAHDRMKPRWVLVCHLFGVGSTVAKALCAEFGFDPHETSVGSVCR